MGLVFEDVSREPAIAKNRRTDLPCGMNFSREFEFADFEVFEFRGNIFSRIWISNFTRGNSFTLISCMVLESNKNGRHMVVFFTLFATNFIEIQQCK